MYILRHLVAIICMKVNFDCFLYRKRKLYETWNSRRKKVLQKVQKTKLRCTDFQATISKLCRHKSSQYCQKGKSFFLKNRNLRLGVIAFQISNLYQQFWNPNPVSYCIIITLDHGILNFYQLMKIYSLMDPANSF